MSGRPRGRQYRDRRSFSSSGSERQMGPGRPRSNPRSQLPAATGKRSLRHRSSRSLSPLPSRGKIGRSRSPHRTLSPTRRDMIRSQPLKQRGEGQFMAKKRSLSPTRGRSISPLHKTQRSHEPDSFRFRKTQPEFEKKRLPNYAGSSSTNTKPISREPSSKYKDYDKFQSISHGGPIANRLPMDDPVERNLDSRRSTDNRADLDRHRSPPGNTMIRHNAPLYNKEPVRGRENFESSNQRKEFQHKNYDLPRDEYPKKMTRQVSPSPMQAPTYRESISDRYRDQKRMADHHSKPTFSREDLEKITIDIRRSVKDPSPTRRAIINPSDVKVVRRNHEGARPLFDREEIRNPTVDLREDALVEHRVITVKPAVGDRDLGGLSRPQPSLSDKGGPRREVDIRPYNERNSQITLSERWQSYDSRKPSQHSMGHTSVVTHEAHFEKEYRDQRDRSIEKLSRNRPLEPPIMSREGSSRYRESSLGKDYGRQQFLDEPGDLRQRLARRKDNGSSYEYKRKFDNNYNNDRSSGDGPSSHYQEGRIQNTITERESRVTSSSTYSTSYHLDRTSSRDRSKSRERSHLPDFSQRPDRFKYTEWVDKPEVIPKGSSYYEVDTNHDDRNKPNMRFRGRGRVFRPRGLTGGTTRGTFRGSSNYRGNNFRANFVPRGRSTFRGNRGGPRGNTNSGYSSRSKSPSHWEHDLFNKMSPDKGN